jgi:3-isopropylmalate/(R)-2-methylmalate dehydratase large subunit
MGKSLFDKVWDLHRVATLPSGQDQIFIGLHLVHEVTSPQAFQMLRERQLSVMFPNRTFATVDHIVPTLDQQRPFADELAEEMMVAIEQNTKEAGVRLFGLDSGQQGIVHVVGPELGLTQPGMIVVCGDSHTATHGAFGALAFGIGTSQVRDVLATQSLALDRLKVRRIWVTGELAAGVTAKDLILKIIQHCGVNGGLGYAYEYAGPTVAGLDMEERMTVCNMSIEGAARAGYVNPDEKTFDYLRDRPYAPKGHQFDHALSFWRSMASDDDAEYADEVRLEVGDLEPMVTWGINPAQSVQVNEPLPRVADLAETERPVAREAYEYMGFEEGKPLVGQEIDVAFVGSCTNGRISDLREAAEVVRGRQVASSVKALVVPGSMAVRRQAEAEGLDKVFEAAGFSWREAGCSMCLAMNPDKLQGRQLCASSSNRNFMGRQGSPTGRTLLMSPAMVAAAAVTGKVTDARTL